MIVYVDSSIVARAYLADEPGHNAAVAVLRNPENTIVTGSWTRIEVTGALIRSARARGRDAAELLAGLEADITTGAIMTVDVLQAEVEGIALSIVKRHGTRAMDAWHLACASIALPALAEPGEQLGFATRDAEQAAVARELGFATP